MTRTMADLRRRIKPEPFVGRREEQKAFREAIQKLMSLHRNKLSEDEEVFKRIFLLYGEGGMGKTALLDRFTHICREEGGDDLTIIKIDWDEYENQSINSSTDIMDTIYRQISRDFREELKPYQEALQQQAYVGAKVIEIRKEFPLLLSITAERSSISTGSHLVGNAEIETATQSIKRELTDSENQRDEWIRGNLTDQEYKIHKRPQLALSEALVQGLMNAAEQKPVVLMFDTYEQMDQYNGWIRDGLILHGSVHIVYVISGRNDHTAFYRDQYRDEVLQEIKLKNFSRLDIEDYLQARNISAPQTVVEAIDAISRGVPLAVKAVAKVLSEHQDLQTIFGDLAQAPLLEKEEVVREVTRRFLRYCLDTDKDTPEVRHSKSIDRSRIYTLALMRQHNDRVHRELILKVIWGDAEKGISEDQIDDILLDLASRYSFIFGPSADMHQTVKKFINMALRDQSIPRGDTTKINSHAYDFATTKMESITGEPEDLYRRSDYQEYCLDCLNHLLWIDQREAMRFLAKHFVKALGANRKFSEDLLKIAVDDDTYEHLSDEHKRIIWALENVATWTGGSQEQVAAAEKVRTLLFEWLEREEKIVFHLRNASNMSRRGRSGIQRALKELKEAELLCLTPDEMRRIRAETYIKVAEVLSSTGSQRDGQEAISLLNRTIELEASNAYAYALLGRLFSRRGEIEKALEVYETASSIGTSATYVEEELEQLRILIAKLEKGESSARIASPDKLARALTISGNILANAGLLEKASEKYRMALSADSSYAQANVKLGHVLRQLGRFDEAEQQFHLAERLSARAPLLGSSLADYINALAYDGLAALKRQMGNLPESISLYKKAIDKSSHYSNAYNGLGKAYCLQGHAEEARKLFTRALKYKPDAYWVFNNLGIVFLLTKQESEAVKIFEKAGSKCQEALRNGSRLYLSYFNLGIALIGKGEYGEGLRAFQKASSICTAAGFLGEVISDIELIERGRPDEKMKEVVTYLKELYFSSKQ